MRTHQTMRRVILLLIACGFPFSVTPLFGSLGGDPPPGLECKVTVAHDRTVTSVHVRGGTVGQALQLAGIAVDGDDLVTPTPSTAIQRDVAVEVVRVTRKTITEDVRIAAPRTIVASSRLRRGRAEAVQAGRDGKVARSYEVVYYNGKERSRKLLSESVVATVRPHVIAMSSVSLASRHGRARRSFEMVATAYSAQQSGIGTRTAIGLRTGQGVAAVDPRVIPLGERVYVEGYGFAIAADTGGSIRGNRIDLAFDTVREARRFGRRRVVVHVLD